MRLDHHADDGFTLVRMLTGIALLAVFMGNVLPALPQPIDPPAEEDGGPEDIVCIRVTWDSSHSQEDVQRGLRAILSDMGHSNGVAEFESACRRRTALLGIWYPVDWDTKELIGRVQKIPGVLSVVQTDVVLDGA